MHRYLNCCDALVGGRRGIRAESEVDSSRTDPHGTLRATHYRPD